MTNVGLLESIGIDQKGPGADEHVTVYIEGVGTVDEREDSLWDAARGQGDTGVPAKVSEGIDRAVEKIVPLVGAKTLVWVQFDTYGFSRGAAAARNCIWKCLEDDKGNTLKKRLSDQGKPPGEVRCKFVGLFDTVASYGLISHRNNTAELHLDAVASAEKVLHLAAAEEHRANFRLTNIASAGGKGEEFFLPGVHSDIGGGYNTAEDEVGRILFSSGLAALYSALERDGAWLVRSGWYRAGELSVSKLGVRITANRIGITNLYSRIPLGVMADYSRRHGVHIRSEVEVTYAIPPDNAVLVSASNAVKEMVGAEGGKSPSAWFGKDPSEDPAWHKALRHDHLHFSAHYNGLASPHSPHWDGLSATSGTRSRVIQRG